jgi:hypothetical protein
MLVSQHPPPCQYRRTCGGVSVEWIACTLLEACQRIVHETDQRNGHTALVLEAWLGTQQGDEVVLTCPGKCGNPMRLQLSTYQTSNHVSLLGREDCGSSENLSSCR